MLAPWGGSGPWNSPHTFTTWNTAEGLNERKDSLPCQGPPVSLAAQLDPGVTPGLLEELTFGISHSFSTS